MTRELYSSVEQYLSSDELQEYRELIKEHTAPISIKEEEFNIDDINIMETISYPMSWGISALDKALGGRPVWKYMMLYGGPSSGKTTLTFQIAISNQTLGNKQCYLSLEMPKKDFIIQNMRSRAWLKQVGVGESILPSPSQQIIMKCFLQSIKDIDIKWYVKQPSMKEFKEIMNSLRNEGYTEIIIDNLWMIGRSDGKDEMILYWEISSFIKDYCDSTWIGVMMLHHTNKWWESSNGKRWFGAFRWNWKIADDCDYVVQLQREFLETGETQSTIKIEKDRIGWRNGYTCPLEFYEGVFSWDPFW